MRIRCFCGWETPEKLFDRIKTLYGETYKNLTFVNDDSFTHAVIFNTMMPELNIPKENVIGLAQEPLPFLRLTDRFISYSQNHIKEYYLGTTINRNPFISGYSYLFYNYSKDRYWEVPEKKGKIAIWCSHKKDAPGHIYRHVLVRKILEKNLDVDIWGNGCGEYHGENVKGKFIDEPYKDYEYCISIENFITEDYISEKFLNCIAHNTIPVYLGAVNTKKHFGDCFIELTGNVDNDLKIIIEIMNNNPKKDLTEARKKLFEGELYFPEFLSQKWN